MKKLAKLLWTLAGLAFAASLTSAAPAWAAVTVSITSPADGTVFQAPVLTNITASASATGGYSVSKVEFFDGTTLIGTDTTSPYSVLWTGGAYGVHTLTAKATATKRANPDQTATSVPVTVTVTGPQAPNVSITSPANNAIFTAPENITITADASDPDGSVTQVEFYRDGLSIGIDSTAPYSVVWSNVSAGTYSLTARATDNAGLTRDSSPINIIVNAPPTVSLTSPTNNATFNAPANITLTATASDSDGTISKVEFFYGGTNLIATLTSPPYSLQWTSVPQGAYALTAVATDNLNSTTTSTPVNVTVGPAVALLYFIHADHLDTPRLISDANQQTVWRYDNAEPFGDSPADENPSGLGVFEFDLGFPGQRRDRETGIWYNYQRDGYDSAIGRYTQADSAGLWGGLNLYAYVHGNPLSFTDPTGLVAASTGSAFPGGTASQSGSGSNNVCVAGKDCSAIRQMCINRCLPLLFTQPRWGQASNFHKCVADCLFENGC